MQRLGRDQEYSTRTIFVSVRGVKICTKHSKVVLQVSFVAQGGVLLAVEVNRIKKSDCCCHLGGLAGNIALGTSLPVLV